MRNYCCCHEARTSVCQPLIQKTIFPQKNYPDLRQGQRQPQRQGLEPFQPNNNPTATLPLKVKTRDSLSSPSRPQTLILWNPNSKSLSLRRSVPRHLISPLSFDRPKSQNEGLETLKKKTQHSTIQTKTLRNIFFFSGSSRLSASHSFMRASKLPGRLILRNPRWTPRKKQTCQNRQRYLFGFESQWQHPPTKKQCSVLRSILFTMYVVEKKWKLTERVSGFLVEIERRMCQAWRQRRICVSFFSGSLSHQEAAM